MWRVGSSKCIQVITSLFLHFSCVRVAASRPIHNHSPIKGAVATNGPVCAEIGANILEKGGNAVEAAIATLLCEGISVPQTMGLGGGFIMTIYHKDEAKFTTLNARETAPAASHRDMFQTDQERSIYGGLAVAVPGELRGYWHAYKRFGGRIPWRDLVQPSIDLSRKGVEVTREIQRMLIRNSFIVKNDSDLREMFVDPETQETYKVGDYIKRPKLAQTLEVIAEEGGDALNNGSLTENFVKDVEMAGGIITKADMMNYSPEWGVPTKVALPFGQTMYSFPAPGSGPILGFILKVLDGFLDLKDANSIRNFQRMVESFKYAYAKRTKLADPNFVHSERAFTDSLISDELADYVRGLITDDRTFQTPQHYGIASTLPDDHGTAHVSILAPNGDAVSVTSTINYNFGAGIISPSTGIILNNQMADFSSPEFLNIYDIPPSSENFIAPGKRPTSSMVPTIVLQDNDVRLIIGAAGGPKITTSVVQVMIKNLWYNTTLPDAIIAKRIHHQLVPMILGFEDNFDAGIVDEMNKLGHVVSINPVTEFTAVTAISRENGKVLAVFDPRRGGGVAYV